MLSLSALAVWFNKPGIKKDTAAEISALLKASSLIEAPNPAVPGMFKVRTLFYGSGRDKHRREYDVKAYIITESVDASPFVPSGWSVARINYWGFDQTHLPINGRV